MAAGGGAGDYQPCRYRKNKCKKVSGDNDLQFCDKHYNFHINFLRNNPSIIQKRHHHLLESETSDLNKKNKKEKKMKKKQEHSFILLPPDEQRCCLNDGIDWRCKNFRIKSFGADGNTSKYCEKHLKSEKNKQLLRKKKRSRDDEFDDCSSDIETRDSKCLKRRRKQQLPEEDYRTGGIQSPTNHTSFDGIVGRGGFANIGTKGKGVETTSGELNSLKGIREPVIEMKSLEHYKTKCFELSVELGKKELELEKKNLEIEKKNVEGTKLQGKYEKKKLELEKNKADLEKQKAELEKKNLELETKNVECTKLQGEYEKKKLELEKKELEHEKQKEELEKKELEHTILQDKYAELEIRKTAAKDEDAVKYRKNKCSDLESLFQRMDIENSTLRCETSRLSNLEGLVPRNGNESSILGCEELSNSEKIEAEARGLQNEITQSVESCGGRKDSHVDRFKTKENVLNAYDVDVNKHHESESEFPIYSAMKIPSGSLHLPSGGENVEEGNGSQDHLDISKDPFAISVSDDGGESLGDVEDSDSSFYLKNFLGHLVDMLAMKYRNRNDEKEMKWKSEPELLSSFEEDPEICLKAVCALYRQEISEDEISPKGLYIHSDTLRVGWNTKV
ncbi:hypothetical protein MKX03_002469 [Papaver bracteatum]|nr:hypothetical protein MKX03_002469 [Papaver bracteatum]